MKAQIRNIGGNVKNDMSDKQLFIAVPLKMPIDAHIVVIKKYLQDIMTYSPQIQS